MQTETFVNNQYDVNVVRVTEENIEDVAAWCGGQIHTEPQGRYIQVPVANPLRPRQTKAFVGDRVLQSKTGFKSYTEGAFQKSFSPKDEPLDELLTTNEPVDAQPVTSNIFAHDASRVENQSAVDPRDQISGKRR